MKRLNEDLYGLDKPQPGATKQLHSQAVNSKDQICSRGLAIRASDAKTQHPQDHFFKDVANYDNGNNAITMNSSNVEPSHQHWQANQASDPRGPIAPCLSSQLLTYREQSQEPLNCSSTLDGRHTRVSSNYKPPQPLFSPAYSYLRPSEHPHATGHHQNAAPASSSHRLECHSCAQLTLKATALQEKVSQLEEANKALTEKAQQAEGERSADAERIQELVVEVEGLKE